ncbi:MAG: hypothetical protein IKO68_04050 [Oscillospiraceae bacterium]|nr:hypothetical protein [Oscillospiraceae bacterium]
MNNRISDLLDCLDESGQALKPRGGNTARVRERTLAKLHGAQTLHISRRPPRTLRLLIAAAAAVMLLCGSVFAAWKLGAFRFQDAMGQEGALLDDWAVSLSPEDVQVIPADWGYDDWLKLKAAGYNLVVNELREADGCLKAELDVSPENESLPPFRDSGLRLGIAGSETESRLRKMDAWMDRITLTAPLTEKLSQDTELRFVVFGSDLAAETEPVKLGYSRYVTPEDAEPREYRFANAAETKDYRFSLRTLAMSEQMIYAVMDVEARSDYGLAHLDEVPEFAVVNESNPGSGILLDARLMESGEGVRRYLIGELRNHDANAAGDVIRFELLSLREAGDTAKHPYFLFHVKMEQLTPGLQTAEQDGEASETGWERLRLDCMSLTLENSGGIQGDRPTNIVLVFRDGTRETVLRGESPQYDSYAPLPEGHSVILTNGGGRKDGSEYLNLVFARPLNPNSVEAIEFNGQRFPMGE